MRLLVDSSALVTMTEPSRAVRFDVVRILRDEPQAGILSPFGAAEVDYFLQRRRGPRGNAAFIRDLAAGRIELAAIDQGDLSRIAELNERYADLSAGLADLSLVVLAARYRTTRILTLDQRHFRALQPLQGGHFTLLPYDEDIA